MRIRLGLTSLVFLLSNALFAQTADEVVGCAPLSVNFTAPVGYATWDWNFKDGSFSTLENPSNTFIKPGTYVVEFRETSGGNPIGTVTINVHKKPVFQITASTPIKGCVPLDVSMTATSSPPAGITINSYDWVYGDGGSGTGISVTNTYSTEGNYDVSLKINTSSVTCDTTKIFTNFISASDPPVASFVTTPDPPISCTAPLNVSFNNASTSTATPLTYEWNLDGVITTGLNAPDENYIVDGSYTAKLVVSDTNNCADSVVQTIAIGKPTSNFIAPDTVCMNATFFLDNTSSLGALGDYLWTFDAGSSKTTSTSFEPSLFYTIGGDHTITLTSTSPNGACSHDTTFSVFVEDPVVTVTSAPSYSCSEPRSFQLTANSSFNLVSWNWTFENLEFPFFDTNTNGPTTNHTFVIPDSMYSKRGQDIFSNQLDVVTANGCRATTGFFDTIHLVWARFMPDTAQGCAPMTVIFSDSSKSNDALEPLVTWAWDYGDGSPIDTRADNIPHAHVYTSAGEYEVVLIATNSSGCKDTSYAVTIKVGEIKGIDFTADKLSVCPGEAVTFTHSTTDTAGIEGWNYSSNGEFLSHCFGDENPTMVFNDSAGLQDITLTADYNGCLTTITKAGYIDVKGPIAHFNYTVTCGALSDNVQFEDQSEDATSLSWDFGDGSPLDPSTGTFTHIYAATGDYEVILTASNGVSGCADSKDTVTVHVKKIQALFTTDTTYCVGIANDFDASASIDVFESCYRGYVWIFSDTLMRPRTSSIPTSSISFDDPGDQTIGLVVTDINGCVDSLVQNIKVYHTPVQFTISDSVICIPDTINFVDISIADTTIVDWRWYFGDGGLDSIQNPTYIFTTALGNSDSTRLTITDTVGCVSTVTKKIDIYNLASTITTNPTPADVCLGTAIDFSATDYTAQGSSLTYLWEYQDGTSEAGNNTTHNFPSANTYVVKMYYTEIASGCFDSTTTTVTVQDYPTAGFYTDADTLAVLCNPHSLKLYDSSTVGIYSRPLSVTWDIDAGTNVFNTPDSVSVTLTKGSHTIKMISSTSNGCKDSITKPFTVVGPEGDFDILPDPPNLCQGDSVEFTIKDTIDVGSYTWDYGDGTSDNDISPVTHTYNYLPPSETATTVAKLIVYGPGGICPVSVPKNVAIRYVKADFRRNNILDTDTLICFGDQLSIIDSSKNADDTTWDLGDGTIYSTFSSLNQFNHLYDSIGTYTISLTVVNSTFGCRDSINKDVIVVENPTVTAVGDSVCFNDTAYLSVELYDSAYSYIWTPATGLNNDSIYNPWLVGSVSRNYSVLAQDTLTGCSTSDVTDVFVVQPLSDYDWDTTIVTGEFVILPIDNQNGLVQYTWTPTTGLSCIDCSSPQIQPLESIDYSAFMEDIVGCFDATATFDIMVKPQTFIKLPTTFTPNGDGYNDIIYVKGWGIKELITFEIYNRWGELMFTSTDLNVGWDGYYKGKLQNNDLYVYKVIAVTWKDVEMSSEGHINLMR